MKKNVILTGFMGSGKSSVGRTLASKLGFKLLDTDQMIEAAEGMTISQIMKKHGEEYFRQKEKELLKQLSDLPERHVISTGGGLPIAPGNAEALKQAGYVVYLRAKPETILKRLSGDTTRPLLMGEDKERRVRELMEYREPIYTRGCHLPIDTDGKSLLELTDDIVKRFNHIR